MKRMYLSNKGYYTMTIMICFAVALLSSCSDINSSKVEQNDAALDVETIGPLTVVHHASMGGADLCESIGLPTGCDKNFSLVANQFSDGSVRGQWQDGFAGGGEGIHVSIDCLNIDGNAAIVSGTITKGTAFGTDVSGQTAVTAVVDNGTSTGDASDQISFSVFPFGATCNDVGLVNFINAGFIFDLTHGQVTVW